MATATATSPPLQSPPAAPSPADHIPRKSLPLSLSLQDESFDWSHDITKPLPTMPPPSESPRLRQPPLSPVRVNFHPENWAQPTNANIESSPDVSSAEERNLPRSLDRPSSSSQQTPTLTVEPPQTIRPVPSAAAAAAASGQDSLTAPFARLQVGSSQAGPSQQPVSAESSATTSASSVSSPNERTESAGMSPESSLEDGVSGSQSVPQLQYHHQHAASSSMLPRENQQNGLLRSSSNPDLAAAGSTGSNSPVPVINRHLTPTSHAAHAMRYSSLPRPQSSYSMYSDLGARSRSPGFGARRSPDVRPTSYAEMLNVPYPQPAPAPISLDNKQLRNAVGSNASLLSTQKTLEMYRQNVKKTNDLSIQYSFAVFLISTAQEQGLSFDESTQRKNTPKQTHDLESAYVDTPGATPIELVREARTILQRLSNAGYPFAQYYLADGYASGLFNKGKEDYHSAFPLFVLAAKHGHAEAAYRTGLCYEFGWGCRKDPTKAIQFLRTAAAKRHPGAMTRLGKACLSGDLGEKRYREGIKWLKLATEAADTMYNVAPYQLGCLYETGYGDDIFKDESYAAELFTQAAELGNADASYRMGDAYEHGRLNCPLDPALSVHFYTGAAERGHPAAMMGLCAWYMVGAEPLLEKDEEEAYEWARRSAELGYVKAQYAVGYFTEMGIGCRRDILEANVWYVKAADGGDERAKHRLAAIRTAVSGGTPMEVGPPRSGKMKKNGAKDENCAVM